MATSRPPRSHVAVPPIFCVHLPILRPTNVGRQRDPDGQKRHRDEIEAVVAQVGVGGAERVEPGVHVEDGGCGEPDSDPHPIHPEAKEAVPRPEIAARPEIQPSRSRVLHGECRHRHREGHGEEDRGEQPQRNGTRNVRRGGDPARADDAGDAEEREVAEPEFAFQRGLSHRAFLSATLRRCGADLR
jgi:hypothetical protein